MHERIQTFEELALRLRPDGTGGYDVQVVRSSYGCRDVHLDAQDLGASWTGLAGLARTLVRSRELGEEEARQRPDSEMTPEFLGGTLFRALFRDDLLWAFLLSLGRIQGREDLGLRLRLIFDPLDPASRKLLSLPWELLYRPDTRDFLARSRFTPIVRYLEVPRLTAPLKLDSQLRILVALANPEGTQSLDLERECQQMATALQDSPRISLKILRRPSLAEARSALQKSEAHVFHYMGHGSFDAGSGEGSLLFEDSQRRPLPVVAGVLADALKDLPSLRLVVLNACRTAQVSEDPKLDPFSGSASALALAGVPAILAMQLPISDRAALVFSQRLYEMLAQAFPVDAAVAEARLAVHLDSPSSYEWATPAFYMSVPDGQIFAPAPAVPEPSHPASSPESPTVSGHGTVGAAGGITIGGSGNQIQGDIHYAGVTISGQGHHIEGGIHVTLADLDGVDPATKRAIRQRYENQVRDHPEQAQYHFALGLSYLDQGLYDLSAAALQRALGKTTHEEDLLYYLGLALIGGKRPRSLKLATVRQIETYLAAAIRLDDRKAHYKLLLAMIKYDYYASNGLRIPPPGVDQLLKAAADGDIDSREVRLMLQHAPLPAGDLLSVVQNFCH